MGIEGVSRDGATLHDYLRVLRRRKWIILTAIIVVPAVAVAMSMRQQALYQSTAEVLLTEQGHLGGPDRGLGQQRFPDVRAHRTDAGGSCHDPDGRAARSCLRRHR